MNTVKLRGVIKFDPINITKKHETQSEWKIVAMVMFYGEVAEYYSWFLKKRYNLILNKPLRGGHITFINDKFENIAGDSEAEKKELWEAVKERWDGTKVDVILDVDARTNGKHWWFNIPEEDRADLHNIRAVLGLGRPNFGLHMSLGYASETNIEHSKYIHSLIKNKLIK